MCLCVFLHVYIYYAIFLYAYNNHTNHTNHMNINFLHSFMNYIKITHYLL